MDPSLTRLPALLSLLALFTSACASPGVGGVLGDSGEDAVGAVLDDWHLAAAQADQGRYLGHFAPDAVFLGTDASERWTLEEFTAYVELYFPKGGWTYRAQDRHVAFSSDGDTAWIDELLHNDKYGVLRGTGVLRRTQGGWKIAHYSMTFAVPNDVSAEVVGVIQR